MPTSTQSLRVTARIVFEIVGNPKEHVIETINRYLTSIKQEEGITFKKEYIADVEERDGLWSTFAEVELIVPDLDKLTWLCVNFTPASVEILEPAEFHLTDKQVSDWQNDLLALLHEIGAHAKNMTSENDLLKVNINRLIRNSIILALKHAPQGMSAPGIGSDIGIEDESALKPFFDAMEKERRIRNEDGTYHLA